jgi:hypothetical protein
VTRQLCVCTRHSQDGLQGSYYIKVSCQNKWNQTG